MLVVVHHRYVAFFFQTLLYFETFGSFYIFKIYTAESGRNSLYNIDKLFRVFFIDFNIKAVESGKNLKQQGFTFHHGLTGFGTYITKT